METDAVSLVDPGAGLDWVLGEGVLPGVVLLPVSFLVSSIILLFLWEQPMITTARLTTTIVNDLKLMPMPLLLEIYRDAFRMGPTLSV